MADGPDITAVYIAFVETITANEQRRQNASAIYVTLISAWIAYWAANPSVDPLVPSVLVSIGSALWFLKLSYFRALAKAKFEVVKTIEEKWDLRPFELEWAHFKSGRRFWARPSLTFLEMGIPVVLFFLTITYCAWRAIG